MVASDRGFGATEGEPFVGPRPYEPDDADRFFGRDREADNLRTLIKLRGVVVAYGEPGVGKTSLVNARLLSLLQEEGCDVLPVVSLRGARTDSENNPFVAHALSTWSESSEGTLPDYVRDRPRKEGESSAVHVMIFDHVEDLFTLPDLKGEESRGFFDQIRDSLAQDPDLRVLFVVDTAHRAEVDGFASTVPGRLWSRFRVDPLRRASALEVVTVPVESAGRRFGTGVAEQLVDRVSGANGEADPLLLQMASMLLWRGLPPGETVIEEPALERVGDMETLPSRYYDQAIKEAAGGDDSLESALREWMGSLAAAPAALPSLWPSAAGGVEILALYGVIRPQRDGYTLGHERLAEKVREANLAWQEAVAAAAAAEQAAAKREPTLRFERPPVEPVHQGLRWRPADLAIAATALLAILATGILLTPPAPQTVRVANAPTPPMRVVKGPTTPAAKPRVVPTRKQPQQIAANTTGTNRTVHAHVPVHAPRPSVPQATRRTGPAHIAAGARPVRPTEVSRPSERRRPQPEREPNRIRVATRPAPPVRRRERSEPRQAAPPPPPSVRVAEREPRHTGRGVPDVASLLEEGSSRLHTGRYLSGMEAYQQALDASRAARDRAGEARVLVRVARSYCTEGWLDDCVRYYRRAAAIQKDIGDRRGEARTQRALADVLESSDRPEEAQDARRRADELEQSSGSDSVQ